MLIHILIPEQTESIKPCAVKNIGKVTVPDHEKLGSRFHLCKAHIKPGMLGILNGEGMGRGWKGGVQFTSNLGPRWTGSYHDKEGFQVSKGK